MGSILLILELLSDTLVIFRNKIMQKIFRNTYMILQTELGAEILKLNVIKHKKVYKIYSKN